MTATPIRLSDPEICRFSTTEGTVLRRLSDAAGINTIAHELGLAAPLVGEYVKSVLRKVRDKAEPQRP